MMGASPVLAATPKVSSISPASEPVRTRANPFRTGRTLVIPHAGGDGLFPENTVLAYERSLALGGDVVDIDIRLTSDGVPIAFHDPTLDRTTNGTGSVASRSLAEISTLDAGATFRRGGTFPYRNRGVRVPTLVDVLRRFPDRPTTLDLKDRRVAVVAPVCMALRSLKRTHDVYVGIDVDEQVVAFRKQCPEVATSGTSAERAAARTARESGDPAYRTAQLVSQPRFVSPDGTRRVTAETLAFSHRHGTAVLTWVVDNPRDMAELIRLGVDGIYTRRPDVLVRVLREQQG